MGCFCTIIGDKIIEGNLSLPEKEMSPEQRAMASLDLHNVRIVSDPFTLVLITYIPCNKTPYHLTYISPRYYSYFAFDQEDFIRNVRDREQHQHNTYELVYVREGELFQRVEFQRHKYSAGSCFLLNRNVRHNEEYISPFSTVSLSLSAEFFQELISEENEKYFSTQHLWNQHTELQRFFEVELGGGSIEKKSCIDFISKIALEDGENAIQAFFEELTQIILSPSPGCSFLFKNLICRIFLHLSQKRLYTTVPIELGSEAAGRIFSQITSVLEQNNGRVSREKLSQKLRYSGSYLNRIVNKYTGVNISQYATSFSMKRAAWMLLYSNATVSEIAMELGFTNRTNFYNAFKKIYGETPRQYRIRNQAKY